MVLRTVRLIAAVTAGVLSGLAEVLFLLLAGLAGPRRSQRLARRIAGWERRRIAYATGTPSPPVGDAPASRVYGYLASRLVPAVLGALTVGLLGVGVVLAGIVLSSCAAGTMSAPDVLLQVVIGAALLVVDLQAVATVAALDRRLARRLLDSGSRADLERRIGELAASRAEVVAAVDAERRRIERDLHDGLQQRLVALGMLLGRARRSRDPDQARDLLAQAHADAQRAIEEMREVTWRVYPTALDHSTLAEVLTMVGQRSAVPVTVAATLPVRPPRPIETALYFAACEAITNAAKHAGASVITVRITGGDRAVEMLVGDDGTGGADPAGSGLSGLARRVAALDGRFDVRSTPGAGTTIVVELPCG
jgi:signal transduction histidine kinase